MKIEVKPGKYILAVSGGVDSMVLLELLAKHPGLEIVVAHFNHGIRDDAGKDEALVRQQAAKYALSFEVGYGELGPAASEDHARAARYEFLRAVKKKYNADKIITAHHRDDLIETAILNILRGTGPRGLTAITANKEVLRPLLAYDKSQIKRYAKNHKLEWREDTTNSDEKYLRNLVRSALAAKMTPAVKKVILDNINKVAKLENSKDELIESLSKNLIRKDELNRAGFRLLPFEVGNAVLYNWLKYRGSAELNRQLVIRLNNTIRTGRNGTGADVDKRTRLSLNKTSARLKTRP